MRKLMLTLILVLGCLLCGIPNRAAAQTNASAPTVPEPAFKVGDVAPDFTLKDQNGSVVSLHDFRGKKKVVLAFYIFAFTGG